MPFKIVQTIEKGKAVLTTIPESWEKEGVLLWPKVKGEKLKMNEANCPEDDWGKFNCIVKRKDILSYQGAERELKKMCLYSDTETCASETEDDIQISPPKQKRIRANIAHHEDFNDVALECTIDHAPVSTATCVMESSTINDTFAQEVDSNVYFVTQETGKTSPEAVLPTNITTMIEQQSNMLTFMTTIMENQRMLFNNLDNISLKQAQLSTQFEEFTKRFFCHELKEKNDDFTDFKAIANIDDLENFENILKNSTYRADLKKKFHMVVGNKYGNGVNSAYKLVDIIFEREFMSKCSWSGGSRSNDKKICFKAFQRTVDFFFQIIRASDECFTVTDCESFLKNILRNSKKRSETLNLRQSAKKNRPKNIKKNVNNKGDERKNDETLEYENKSSESEGDKENDSAAEKLLNLLL